MPLILLFILITSDYSKIKPEAIPSHEFSDLFSKLCLHNRHILGLHMTSHAFLAPTKPRDFFPTDVTQSSIFLIWQRPDPPNGLITNYTVSNNNVMLCSSGTCFLCT